jgi:pectate lyase
MSKPVFLTYQGEFEMSLIQNVPPHEFWYETPIGWASEAGGTTGGGREPVLSYHVRDGSELKQAIAESGDQPKRIWIEGVIDVSEGQPYVDRADQSRRGRVFIGSNTTLIGMTPDAKIIEGALFVQDVNNVIVHNLYIENPVDVEPQFEEGDGWNAEWDGLSIVRSQHVWVSHVTFSDGRFTMDQYKEKEGPDGKMWKYVQHDGALDVKRASDYVTVSNCIFELHDKLILIGHSDGNGLEDTGHLRVTFHNNLFNRVVQRTPRVRFGRVHLFNNVFDNDMADLVYPYDYSFGVGVNSSILSELNIFKVKGLEQHCRMFHGWGGEYLRDAGSTFNGPSQEIDPPPQDWNSCGFNTNLDWTPPYTYHPEQFLSEEVENSIRNGAGNQFNYRTQVGS